MNRGPKNKPTKLHVLAGTYRDDRANPDEPEPVVEIPDPPEHLGESAVKEWERITVELKVLGLISKIDRAAIAAYCAAYGRWVDAEKDIKEKGMTETTTNGNIIQSPLVGIANKSMELMYKFLTEFGMTPASRPKVSGKKVGGGTKKSPFDK